MSRHPARRAACTALGLAGLALAAPAHGQSTFACEAAGGQYFKDVKPLPGPDYHVRGKLKALEFNRGGQWYPVAGATLVHPAGTSIQVRFSSPGAPQSRKLFLSVLASRDGQPHWEKHLGYRYLGDEVEFELFLGRNGKGFARIGDERRSFQLRLVGPIDLGLTCSSGKFIFTELKVGN